MTGMTVSFSHGTFTIRFPRDVAGPLDRPVAMAFLHSLDKNGLVELIHFAAETLAARTGVSMSELDRIDFERWRDELEAEKQQ